MAIRKRLGLNQTDFARLLGARQKMISQYECGRVKPSPPQIIKLLGLAGLQHGGHQSESLVLTSFLYEQLGLSETTVIALIDAELEDLRARDAKIEARLQELDEEEKRLGEQEKRLLRDIQSRREGERE